MENQEYGEQQLRELVRKNIQAKLERYEANPSAELAETEAKLFATLEEVGRKIDALVEIRNLVLEKQWELEQIIECQADQIQELGERLSVRESKYT